MLSLSLVQTEDCSTSEGPKLRKSDHHIHYWTRKSLLVRFSNWQN